MTMMAWWVLCVFIGTLLALARWQGQADRIFGLVLMLLYIPGAISSEALLACAANNGLITLVLLICMGFVLEKTLLLQRAAAWMLTIDFERCWWRVMLSSIASSALLNNTAIVSIMLGPLRSVNHHPARRLLLPMTYAVSMGGMLTLVGTSTNLIVNSMIMEAGLPGLHLLDFLPVGTAVVVVGIFWLWCRRYQLSAHPLSSESVEHYLVEGRLEPASPLVGKTVAQAGLRHLQRLFLVEIVRAGEKICPVPPHAQLEADDRLLFSGESASFGLLARFKGLVSYAQRQGLKADELTEVLVLPDSSLCGIRLKESNFRAKFDAAVVAIRRNGEALSGAMGEQILYQGDFLVLATGKDFLGRANLAKNFLIIRGARPATTIKPLTEWLMICGFLLAIILSACGVLSLFKSMVCYLGILLISGTLTLNELRRRLPLGLWLIVMSALAMAKAMDASGLMAVITESVEVMLVDTQPQLALIGMLIATWMVTEVVTNNATAAMMTPLALALAQGINVSPLPFVMSVAFGASCSFVNPYAYQTNLMALNAGEYRLIDFLRLGLPLALLYLAVVATVIPLLFPFFPS
ncbi:SLC13 family permease [Aeromonas caviae]|uniref:SLC13 family permease n=1 Tax=Aeromonas TaxID=642 RepID=UPI0022E6051D|nr:SLC13 family permease [Aeromonas sp. QDB66]